MSSGKITTAPPATPASAGQPLPPTLQHQMEARSGLDLSDVRVHIGHNATLIGAVAYAQGNNIHLAAGQEHQLAHEAWHVVQQRGATPAAQLSVPPGMVRAPA